MDKMWQNDGLWLLKPGHKRCCGFLPILFLGSLVLGKPCHKDIHTALWRGPHGKELTPPNNIHVREPFWKWILQPNLQMLQTQPASCLQPHERAWARTIQLSPFWILDPQKLCDNMFTVQFTKFWTNILQPRKINIRLEIITANSSPHLEDSHQREES